MGIPDLRLVTGLCLGPDDSVASKELQVQPESDEHPTAEMSSVHGLMELALPRFTMAEGPRQVHLPWSVTSESPASPSPNQIELRGGEDSRCSMDQTSVSSVYLNLDALTSSSNEETLDVKKCEDFAVTIVCNYEEADTHVNSEEVLSDEDFPAAFGAKDIRQVVRQRDRPTGRRAARPGGQLGRIADRSHRLRRWTLLQESANQEKCLGQFPHLL